jgi:hypothetical protein
MAWTEYPRKGARVKRKADGLIGEVYASDPEKDLLTVRWSARPGLNTFVCNSEQFARDWELTGEAPYSSRGSVKSFVVISTLIAICVFFYVKGCDTTPVDSSQSSPPDGTVASQSAPSFRDGNAKNSWRAEAGCLPLTDSNRTACQRFEVALAQADEEYDSAIAQAYQKVEEVDRRIEQDDARARAELLQWSNSWDELSEAQKEEKREIVRSAASEGLVRHEQARKDEDKDKAQAVSKYWEEVHQIIESTKTSNVR